MIEIIDPSKPQHKFPLFSLGFRPFFLGAGIFSFVTMLLWGLVFVFKVSLPLRDLSVTMWHAHEMIYGYSMAVIAGFLLTAVTNWTKLPTLRQLPLFFVFLLWMLARILPFWGGAIPAIIIGCIDNVFILAIAASVSIPVLKTRQWSNAGLISLLYLMLAGNVVYYLGILDILANGVHIGIYTGVYVVLIFILVMGRRVIPFFIEKGVAYPIELKNPIWLDLTCLWGFVLFALADLFVPDNTLVTILAASLLALNALRMFYWYTRGIWSKPLLWVLYLGYSWLLVGLALKVTVVFYPALLSLSLHAFAVGTIGMVTIGMMSRVALGHTGRNVFSPPAGLGWIFAAMMAGTIVRVILPVIHSSDYVLWIGISQCLWVMAFLGFIWIYAPMLLKQDLT